MSLRPTKRVRTVARALLAGLLIAGVVVGGWVGLDMLAVRSSLQAAQGSLGELQRSLADVDLDADEQQALVDAAFAALADMGQTFANVCSIYTPIVAGIVIEDDEEPAAVEAVTDEEPAVVAAQVLAVSGVNSATLAIVGILLLVLGFVAVRRTRDESAS